MNPCVTAQLEIALLCVVIFKASVFWHMKNTSLLKFSRRAHENHSRKCTWALVVFRITCNGFIHAPTLSIVQGTNDVSQSLERLFLAMINIIVLFYVLQNIIWKHSFNFWTWHFTKRIYFQSGPISLLMKCVTDLRFTFQSVLRT